MKLSNNSVMENDEIWAKDLWNLTFIPEFNWIGMTNFRWIGKDYWLYSNHSAMVEIEVKWKEHNDSLENYT